MRHRSLRFRMIVLFCAVVGLFLVCTYGIVYSIFSSELRAQFDKRLNEAGVPMVEDLAANPPDEDVFRLPLPDEYLALLDGSGNLLNFSKSWHEQRISVGPMKFSGKDPIFRSVPDANGRPIRLELIPFDLVGRPVVFAIAKPTQCIGAVLRNFRRVLMVLLPVSVLFMGAISAWYVGRGLAPISELTSEASRFADIVADARHADLTPPRIAVNSRDELGQLASTFNSLFARVLAVVQQLRQFVSDASHELRTPLSVLQGETELLLSARKMPKEYQRNLKVIHSELQHLRRIVDGLFTLSMADAGQLRIATDPVYLNEVLEAACEVAVPLARAKAMRIDATIEAEIICTGDEVLLRDLFLNLLENAVKYSSPGTTVRVSLQQKNGSAIVRFDDQGVGISIDHLPHIFERFYRAPGQHRAQTRSGGLGLAIARAIANAHSGKIEAKSEIGRGSTFVVTLPLSPARELPSALAVTASAAL